MKTPRGLILYEGPSLYDGADIVAIATLHSENRKTGDMVQTWILRADISPVEALRGADASVCGTCPLRPANDGGCYVNVGQAPGSVYRSYRAGLYPVADAESIAILVSGRDVRLGAYGDPAAVPPAVWQGILAHARRHTGYSHGTPTPELAELCMISVSSLPSARAAWDRGMRTFRVGHDGPVPGEIRCPAPRLTCKQCGICDGSKRNLPSVYIDAHGATAARIA